MDAKGIIQLGSAGTASPVREEYRPGSTCQWIITPLEEASRDDGSATRVRLPIVNVEVLAFDLAQGDTLFLFDGDREDDVVGRLPGGTGTRPSGPYVSETGYMKVRLESSSASPKGTGVQMHYYGSRPESVDIYFIAAIIIASVFSCLCGICGVNKLLARRRRQRNMVEENLEMGVIEAQRTGRGATAAVIASFPAFLFEKATVHETPLAKLDEDSLQCSICLCEYEDQDAVRVLLCKHHFHVPCIDQWLSLNRSCPLCKRDVTEMHMEHQSLLDNQLDDPIAIGASVKRHTAPVQVVGNGTNNAGGAAAASPNATVTVENPAAPGEVEEDGKGEDEGEGWFGPRPPPPPPPPAVPPPAARSSRLSPSSPRRSPRDRMLEMREMRRRGPRLRDGREDQIVFSNPLTSPQPQPPPNRTGNPVADSVSNALHRSSAGATADGVRQGAGRRELTFYRATSGRSRSPSSERRLFHSRSNLRSNSRERSRPREAKQ